jgi:hypothetical protein
MNLPLLAKPREGEACRSRFRAATPAIGHVSGAVSRATDDDRHHDRCLLGTMAVQQADPTSFLHPSFVEWPKTVYPVGALSPNDGLRSVVLPSSRLRQGTRYNLVFKEPWHQECRRRLKSSNCQNEDNSLETLSVRANSSPTNHCHSFGGGILGSLSTHKVSW